MPYFQESKGLKEKPRFVIIDSNETFEKNRAFLEKMRKSSKFEIFHVNEKIARKFLEKTPFGFVFSGKYGGNRNLGLVFSAVLQEDIVFFDDDTRPVSNCLQKFEEYFDAGHLLIQGKYVGDTGGTIRLLFELIKTLEKMQKNQMTQNQLKTKLTKIFAGISESALETGELFLGGNLGISKHVSKQYCFFPTDYRLEDALFCRFLPYFCKQARLPEITEPPTVVHKNRLRPIFTLSSNLKNELEGTQIGISIERALTNENHNPLPLQAKLRALYPLEFIFEKLKKEKLDHYVYDLGEESIIVELNKIEAMVKKPPILAKAELNKQTQLFLECQTIWPTAIAELAKVEIVKSIAKTRADPRLSIKN